MANKNYCWSIGTTSFRTSQLNCKIEKQLKLIDIFWKQYPHMKWNQQKTKEDIKKLNMSDDERYPTQVLYYNHLKDNEFLEGGTSLRDKDARAKTSGLVNLGLLDEERKITDVGCSIMRILDNDSAKKSNVFNISEDSYYYLLQLLKLQINNDEFKIKPFIALLYMIQKLDYLSYDEFTYLLPLCKNKYDVIKTVNEIKANRIGFDIDNIIETKILENQQYLKMLSTFVNTYPITDETFELIGMSGKSKLYDRKYKPMYDSLVDLVFHLKNGNIDERIDKYNQLFDCCNEISGNAKGYWKNYLFFGYRKSNFDLEFDKKFKSLDISKIRNIKDFKTFFFLKLHIIKWKINLEDYFDLNRRYFSLTDIIKFGDDKIELDILPKYYFKDKIEELIKEPIIEDEKYKELLYSNVKLEKISKLYTTDISELIKKINKELHTSLTIDNFKTYLEDEKIKNFRNLIKNKFKKENLIKILTNIKNRQDKEVMNSVTDNADIPTIFEYILAITWYMISDEKGNVLKYMNLSLDADLLPKTHAGGGIADIIYEYDEKVYPKHNLIIEATLSDPSSQRKMELESVPRHLAKDIISTDNNKDYALFVASIPEESVILSMRSNRYTYYPKGNGEYIHGFKIIPINIDILINLLKKDIKYDYIYRWFEEAYKSQIPDPEWFDKEILQKI